MTVCDAKDDGCSTLDRLLASFSSLFCFVVFSLQTHQLCFRLSSSDKLSTKWQAELDVFLMSLQKGCVNRKLLAEMLTC